MKQDIQSITDIKGVFANGIHAGIKEKKKDLGYLYVPNAVGSAAVFTQNKFAASSVTYTKSAMKTNTIKAIIINSGNANAGTGKEGEKNTKIMAKQTAIALNLKPKEVAVASTGIIGVQLPIAKIEKSIPKLCETPHSQNGKILAETILTTDKFTKETTLSKKIGKKTITISGITKGSGMIAPNMATTLSFLVTNANIPSKNLQAFLTKAVDESYNMISVDTDTSTNDIALIMATGEYKFSLSSQAESQAFQDLLNEVCKLLAIQIVKDGEGASKMIEVQVKGATSKKEARTIAKSIVDSPLVKTAIYGEDPNWGRVLAAAGKVPSKLNPDKVDIRFAGTLVFSNAIPISHDTKKLKSELKSNEIDIEVDLNLGTHVATAWGCDLTEGYIEINTEYS